MRETARVGIVKGSDGSGDSCFSTGCGPRAHCEPSCQYVEALMRLGSSTRLDTGTISRRHRVESRTQHRSIGWCRVAPVATHIPAVGNLGQNAADQSYTSIETLG